MKHDWVRVQARTLVPVFICRRCRCRKKGNGALQQFRSETKRNGRLVLSVWIASRRVPSCPCPW